jgi:hypothetical protein
MKNRFFLPVAALSLLLVVASADNASLTSEARAQAAKSQLPPPPAPVAWDFSLRPALYANGAETKKVDTKAQYVSAGKTLTLKKSAALSCEGDTCTFNLGFIVFRNGDHGELSTYGFIKGKTLGIAGNTVTFQNGSKVKDLVLPCKLKIGGNKLTVEVDPYKKTAETNEENNSFEVTIIVEP